MILGIDVGYSHTKVKGGKHEDCFRSTIESSANDISNAIKIEYEGNEYTIGENMGLYDTSPSKIESLNFKLCLFTAIARAMKSDTESIELITGLPVQYYKEQKAQLKNELEGKKVTLLLNGKPKHFQITKCLIFPQSAGLFLLNPEKFVGDVCVIDIGGFTVDISYFTGKNLQKFATLELGMNVLHNKLVQEIKAKETVSYDVLKAEEIIKTKTIIDKNADVKIIDDLVDDILKKHASLILNRVTGSVAEYNTSKRIFIGGGSVALKKYLPIKDKIETNDSIYANANAFYRVGVEKFEN